MDRRRFLTLAGLVAVVTAAAPVAAQAESKKKSGGGTYLPMETLLGSTVRPNGARGVLSVDCGLDVPDPALRDFADRSTPRLRAAFVQIIQSYAAGLSPGSLPSADYIAATLQRQTDQVLGRPGARVLLGAILVN
ncbi:MAG: Tat pathway signal protein [Caulobacterales bacterium]|nr:Tat pathway signal protein [Caulobacterales bacterium]